MDQVAGWPLLIKVAVLSASIMRSEGSDILGVLFDGAFPVGHLAVFDVSRAVAANDREAGNGVG